MIAVKVGDEHEVRRARRSAGRDRGLAPQRADPRSEDRVGEDPHPVELDQDRRMTHIGKGRRVGIVPRHAESGRQNLGLLFGELGLGEHALLFQFT